MFPPAIRRAAWRPVHAMIPAHVLIGIALGAATVGSPAARAGEVAALAIRAERLLAAGKGPEAYAAMRAATLAI